MKFRYSVEFETNDENPKVTSVIGAITEILRKYLCKLNINKIMPKFEILEKESVEDEKRESGCNGRTGTGTWNDDTCNSKINP